MSSAGHVVRCIALAASVLVFPELASGQDAVDPRLGAALGTIKTGTTINLTAGDTSAKGTFVRIMADSLALRDLRAERHFALSRIDSLWISRRYTHEGAVAGAKFGAAAVALAAGVYVAMNCRGVSACMDSYSIGIGGGLVTGGLAGGLIGAGIGWLTQTWWRVYP